MAEATERASNTDEVLQAVQSHAEHKHDHHYQAKSLPIVFLKAFIYIATWAAAYNGGIAVFNAVTNSTDIAFFLTLLGGEISFPPEDQLDVVWTSAFLAFTAHIVIVGGLTQVQYMIYDRGISKETWQMIAFVKVVDAFADGLGFYMVNMFYTGLFMCVNTWGLSADLGGIFLLYCVNTLWTLSLVLLLHTLPIALLVKCDKWTPRRYMCCWNCFAALVHCLHLHCTTSTSTAFTFTPLSSLHVPLHCTPSLHCASPLTVVLASLSML